MWMGVFIVYYFDFHLSCWTSVSAHNWWFFSILWRLENQQAWNFEDVTLNIYIVEYAECIGKTKHEYGESIPNMFQFGYSTKVFGIFSIHYLRVASSKLQDCWVSSRQRIEKYQCFIKKKNLTQKLNLFRKTNTIFQTGPSPLMIIELVSI